MLGVLGVQVQALPHSSMGVAAAFTQAWCHRVESLGPTTTGVERIRIRWYPIPTCTVTGKQLAKLQKQIWKVGQKKVRIGRKLPKVALKRKKLPPVAVTGQNTTSALPKDI